jgi:ribosomal protein L33
VATSVVEGHCPYCGVVNKHNITKLEKGSLTCSSCRENIIYRSDRFYQDFRNKRTT